MMFWLLLAFALLFVIGGAFLLMIFLRDEEEDEESPDGFDGGDTLAVDTDKPGGDTLSETLATTTEEYRSARKSRMIALKESLEASLETRHGTVSATNKDRMSMPWFMLVGTEGSGKTTLLANTGLALPYGPAFEVDSRKKDAGRWWLYEDAVVLEAPAALPGTTATGTTLGPDQTQAANTSDGWNTLLHMLRSERPDSPLNGIIVTIAASDLLDARRDPDKLTDRVDRLRIFLERTRRVLGVRLPIHVLVTKCDTLPGFRSFAANLPEDRRTDIFGWANPNKLEAPFNADWVDLGMASLKTQLEDLRDELLAAPDEIHDSDGLFVFVNEFADLHEPLKDFVTRLISEGDRRPPLFFRGMYFCGDAIEATADDQTVARRSGERSTVRISSEVALGDSNAHNIVFVRTLFQQKIFREAGLARPVARLTLSRDRRVVLAQAAAVLIAIVGGAGLFTTLNGYSRGEEFRTGLVHDAERVSAVLAGMAIDLDEVRRGTEGTDSLLERRMRDAAVIDLVSEMQNVVPIRKSAFIPASWFSPLPHDVRRSMVTGIESIVLPVTRQRMQERVDRLLGTDGIESGEADLYGGNDPRALTTYLRDVRVLSRNVARFNALAAGDSGTVADLAGLLEYLFGEQPLRGDSSMMSDDFLAALRQARSPRIDVTPEMTQAVVARSIGMVATVARASAQHLAPRGSAEAEAAVRPEDDIDALRGLQSLVELTDDSTGLVASVADSMILGMPLTRILEDSISAQLRAAALVIGRDSVSPEDAETRLRSVITTLFQLPLMDTIVGREIAADIEPGRRLRWDVGRLELALSLRGDYEQALLTVASAFQGRPLDRMRRAFQVQLRARALDAAASAQRFTPLGAEDPAIEVKTATDNLDQATTRILRAAIMLDTLGVRAEGRRLVSAGARQAEQTLALAMRTYENGNFFRPHAERVAGWLGVQPISFPAMNVTDSIALTTELLRHLNSGVWTQLGDVEKALRYLALPGMDSTRTPRLVAQWAAMVAAVRAYEQADPTSSLSRLFSFVREDMRVRDVESCRAAATARDSAGASDDPFSLRRRQFAAAMQGRCAGAAAAAGEYERIRALFASRLAGRFPFVDSAAVSTSPDVDPVAIREFFRAYDRFIESGGDIALRSDPRMTAAGRQAFEFLERIASVRKFLAPIMDDDRRAPTYGLTLGDRARMWSYGEPLVVRSTDPDAADRTVQGGWAPIRFARMAPTGYERVRFYHPELKLELQLPEFPAAAAGIFSAAGR